MPNTEYADLPFVPPRAFGRGRPAPPRVIVIHYTAGSERSTSAEDGAAYDQRRTDGTSCHYFVDSNSVVQCVYTWDRANSALYSGNRIGVHYELCGTQQTRAQWLDPASDATLTNAARQAARDATKYGIPVRKLSPSQVRAGERGFSGHADITLAYPEDAGDHMDPGESFPWDVFLARVDLFLNGEEVMGMGFLDDSNAANLAYRVDSTVRMKDTSEGAGVKGEPNALVQTLKRIDANAAKAAGSTAPVGMSAAQFADLKQSVLAQVPTAADVAAALVEQLKPAQG